MGLVYRDRLTGAEFDLPKLDVALLRRFEAVDAAEGREARARAAYEALRRVLPVEYLEDSLGGGSFECVDLARVGLTYAEVSQLYNEPERSSSINELNKALSEIDIERFRALADAVSAVNKQGRQGFRNVK